jgi:hypothetical protein
MPDIQSIVRQPVSHYRILHSVVREGMLMPVLPLKSASFGQLVPGKSPKMVQVTDGPRIYFSEVSGGQVMLAQASVTGGWSSETLVPLFSATPSVAWGDLAPNRSRLPTEDICSQEIYSLAAELP